MLNSQFLITLGAAIAAILLIWNAKRIALIPVAIWNAITGRIGADNLAKWARVKEAVMDAVRAVEQISKNQEMASEEKKSLAISLTKDFLGAIGVKEEDERIANLIEAAVFVMNAVTAVTGGADSRASA